MRQIVTITTFLVLAAAATIVTNTADALSSSSSPTTRRRAFLQQQLIIISTTAAVKRAFALDMDAFMNNVIEQDKPRQETDDERTCKYAAPGLEKGEACARAGISTPAGSRGGKGGVDVYGNIDRGQFVRCKTNWDVVDGKYVKNVVCSE